MNEQFEKVAALASTRRSRRSAPARATWTTIS